MDRAHQRTIHMKTPAILCGNLNIPCGQRRKNKSCRCEPCSYAIKTTGLPIAYKGFFLAYSKS